MSSGKSKTMPMQIIWGVEAVYYGIVQVENFYIQATFHSRDVFSTQPSFCSAGLSFTLCSFGFREFYIGTWVR